MTFESGDSISVEKLSDHLAVAARRFTISMWIRLVIKNLWIETQIKALNEAFRLRSMLKQNEKFMVENFTVGMIKFIFFGRQNFDLDQIKLLFDLWSF